MTRDEKVTEIRVAYRSQIVIELVYQLDMPDPNRQI